MFEKENIIIVIAFLIGFSLMWPLNISARKRAKKEAEAKKASAKN